MLKTLNIIILFCPPLQDIKIISLFICFLACFPFPGKGKKKKKTFLKLCLFSKGTWYSNFSHVFLDGNLPFYVQYKGKTKQRTKQKKSPKQLQKANKNQKGNTGEKQLISE